jgi:branched-chain amino acid transport system substrate-binding protein
MLFSSAFSGRHTKHSYQGRQGLVRLFAIATTLAIAALSGCAPPKPIETLPPVVTQAPPPPEPAAANPLDKDQPDFLRLPNLAQDTTPVRIGVILPLSASAPATRALAQSMLKAAELALFDAGNPNIVLITADEGNSAAATISAANRLLAQGTEIIVGPLFGASVAAIAPIARDRGVPVLAFSTEKSGAGHGTYLISFLPENEIARVVSYAADHGHSQFAALVPSTAYGDLAADAMDAAVKEAGAKTIAVEHFEPTAAGALETAARIAKSGADAILIAQGGAVLRAIAPTLSLNGADKAHVKLLGTGLWDDDSLSRESALEGGWYAAPAPDADATFNAKYRAVYGAAPSQLASLAYDAVALVALLSAGEPYHRFTAAALMDPNGFAGVTGVFRFRQDGTSERGLAVLEMGQGGPSVVSPAPTTFLQPKRS